MPDPAPSEQPDLTGQTVGDFHILRKLGQGGMGQVYLARQKSLKREVALKILREDLAANPTALKRFQAEAEAVARVTHANIVQVYAIGDDAGKHYMALEYVEGRNLRDYLSKKGSPDLPLALAIMRQVAAALQRASELGIVHRDIKPENIMITRKAEVKVADFGLSRFFTSEAQATNLTQSGVTLGTPLYMSPEQVQGQTIDHRSDLYSYGVTCYHLLAGEPPYKGATAFEVALQHVQSNPPSLAERRPDLPADLCAMVHKLMAKKLEDRYQTAKEVMRDLAKVREGLNLGLTQALSIGNGSASSSGLNVPTTSSSQNLLAGMSTSSMAATFPPAPRWGRMVLVGAAMLVLVATGWAATSLIRSSQENNAPLSPGLPVARLPEPVLSHRERDLKAKVESRTSSGEVVLSASIELGLLYVKERRFDEANAVFQTLEKEKSDRAEKFKGIGQPFVLAGLCGRAIVLAHQDKPDESIKLLLEAGQLPPRPNVVLKDGLKGRSMMMAFQNFLVNVPELTRAVSDAVIRNEENLVIKKQKLPTPLNWLKSPATIVTGPSA